MKQAFDGERAVWLTVDEVNQLIEALQNAKILKHLNGQQRENLEDAIERLADAKMSAADGKVVLTDHAVALALRCVVYTQRWLGKMYDELEGLD